VHVKIASCVVSYVNPNPEIMCVKFLFKTLLLCYTFSSFCFCLVLKCFFIFFRLKNCWNCCKLKSQLTNQFIILLLTSGFGHWGWSFICCKFKWPFLIISVLWHCWLDIGKSTWPVEIERVGQLVWFYLSGVKCRLFAYGSADATASQIPIISCLI